MQNNKLIVIFWWRIYNGLVIIMKFSSVTNLHLCTVLVHLIVCLCPCYVQLVLCCSVGK